MAVRWASRGGCTVYATAPLARFAGSIDVRTPDLTVRIFRDWGSGLGLQNVIRGWWPRTICAERRTSIRGSGHL